MDKNIVAILAGIVNLSLLPREVPFSIRILLSALLFVSIRATLEFIDRDMKR